MSDDLTNHPMYKDEGPAVPEREPLLKSLADSIGDMLALFDDEGDFREEYQDQASVAIERAEANLSDFLALAAAPPPASLRAEDK